MRWTTADVTPRVPRRPVSSLPGALACAVALSTGTPLTAAPPREQPKEIVLEPGPALQPLDALQQLAADTAFLAGATEVDPPLRLTTRNHDIQHDIGVQGGRCYYIAAAYSVGFRMHVRFTMGPGADDRPISDGLSSGDVLIGPGKGAAHFCVDRPGTVSIRLALDVNAQDVHSQVEYAIAFGRRPETAAQVDARRRAVARGDTNPG